MSKNFDILNLSLIFESSIKHHTSMEKTQAQKQDQLKRIKEINALKLRGIRQGSLETVKHLLIDKCEQYFNLYGINQLPKQLR